MSSSSMEKEKTLTLGSNDGHVFTVKESIAVQCLTIKNMVEDGCAMDTIPISNVDGKTLALVLEYLNLHADSEVSDKEKKMFDFEFFRRETGQLLNLLMAANYLDAKCLLNLLLDTVAGRMKNMTVEEIRENFKVENDYTREEEAKVCKQYAWAFD